MKATLEKWADARKHLRHVHPFKFPEEAMAIECYDALQAADALEVDNQRLLAMIEEYEAEVERLREARCSAMEKHIEEWHTAKMIDWARQDEASGPKAAEDVILDGASEFERGQKPK